MVTLSNVSLLVLGFAATGYAMNGKPAVILADTNRDGKATLADYEGKEHWTDTHGALILANIGDTGQECSKLITPEQSDDTVDKCNDASDNTAKNPKYFAPLHIQPSQEVPMSDGAWGNLKISNAAAGKVRIFRKKGDDWEYIHLPTTPTTNSDSDNNNNNNNDNNAPAPEPTHFTADDLRAGMEFGIDSRDVRRPEGWDGKVTVTLTVHDDDKQYPDAVELRVAPVLIHHVLQDINHFFTVEFPGGGPFARQATAQKWFSDQNIAYAKKMGIATTTFEDSEPWVQDWFETGYTSIPGPDGPEKPIVLQINIRASIADSSSRKVFTEMRSATVGAVQHKLETNLQAENVGFESMGNLETIPPYSLADKTYPAGRAIIGCNRDKCPEMLSFLKAQEVQNPVFVDSSWLHVGHVDEYIQFLPAPDRPRKWVMFVADPTEGVRVLEKIHADGYGQLPAMSRRRHKDRDVKQLKEMKDRLTVTDVLNLEGFRQYNAEVAKHIEDSVKIIMRDTGITEDEILRVPCPFHRAGEKYFNVIKDNTQINIRPNSLGATAFYPSAINGVVFSKGKYAAPRPYGPTIPGKQGDKKDKGTDLFAAAVNRVYAQAHFSVSYLDDYFTHHEQFGDMHCGTNVARDASGVQWWTNTGGNYGSATSQWW